jgi:hypothetical protein
VAARAVPVLLRKRNASGQLAVRLGEGRVAQLVVLGYAH